MDPIQGEDHFIFDLNKGFEEEEDNNDLISIQLSKESIQIHYFQLCKYSRLIQEKYTKQETISDLPQYILEVQKQYKISDTNIIIFFKMIREEKVEITSNQYNDLCKLSTIFQVQVLEKILKRYSTKYSNQIDFMINLLNQHYSQENDDIFTNNNDYSSEIEECLIKNINKCLKNENFKNLPVSLIHRMIKKCDPNKISIDLLYDFISESIESRFLLFCFVDLKKLSENKFEHLYKNYLESKNTDSEMFYQYLSCDLMLIKELKTQKIDMQNKLESEIKEIKEEKCLLQDEKQKLENDSQLLKSQISKLENENKLLLEQNNQINEENKACKQQIDKLKNEDNQKWIHEYGLVELKKKNDDKCYLEIIQTLLNNINFENSESKSGFCQTIFEEANKTGTNDIISVLSKILGIYSKNASIFIFILMEFLY